MRIITQEGRPQKKQKQLRVPTGHEQAVLQVRFGRCHGEGPSWSGALLRTLLGRGAHVSLLLVRTTCELFVYRGQSFLQCCFKPLGNPLSSVFLDPGLTLSPLAVASPNTFGYGQSCVGHRPSRSQNSDTAPGPRPEGRGQQHLQRELFAMMVGTTIIYCLRC